MDPNQLVQNLRAQAQSKSQIVLDGTILAEDTLKQLRTAFVLGESDYVTVKGITPEDIPDPQNGVIAITKGTASVLKCKDVGTHLQFTASSQTVQVIIEAAMPSGWAFTDSFPKLIMYPFSKLTPSSPIFVYSSALQASYPWPGDTQTKIGLAVGLNFLSHVGLSNFSGVISVLGNLVGSSPYRFYGPFSPIANAVYPVGMIAAPISEASFRIGVEGFGLSLSAPAVGVQITPPADDIQDIAMAIGSNLDKKLAFSVALPESVDHITFLAEPIPGITFNANDLIESLPGGAGFATFIPDILKSIFSNINLNYYRMVMTTKSPKVTFVGLGIGTDHPWEVISSVLTLENLVLQVRITDPKGPKTSTTVDITASATFLPKIFTGKFDFNVALQKATNKWSINTISGKYIGNVSLGSIVAGVVGASVSVPDSLQAIVFSDFGVTVTGSDKNYTYTVFGSCSAAFSILDTTLNSQLTVVFNKTGANASVNLSGSLLVGEQNFEFSLKFTSGTTKDLTFTATWTALNENYLQFEDVASAFGFRVPAIPTELNLALKSANFIYDYGKKTIVLQAESAHYATATFIALKKQEDSGRTVSNYVFQMMLGFGVNLSGLPLVGKVFEEYKLGAIKNIQVLFASDQVTVDEVTALNVLLANTPASLPTPQGATGKMVAIQKGFNFGADITLGGTPLPIRAGGNTAPVSKTAPVVSQSPAPPVGNATWIDVKKSIGPVSLERIGVRYEKGRVWLLFDADFTLTVLKLGLQGLALGFKLDASISPTVDLSGMSLSFQSGALQISGGFLHLNDDYLGEAIVKAASFSLMAIGGYAPNDRSFFIFVRLKAALGGPPFFFITGLAGGFGINRSLVLPSIDDLASFPLLPQNNTFPAKLDPANPGGTLASTLKQTEQYVHPQAGQNWLAAGIDFTSFEMVDASAIVTVAFGVKLEIAFLGITRITVPKKAPEPIVYIEIALEARFTADSGLLAIDGRITPASFLYSQLCHLTGGFAFYTWFSGPNEGDFVVTVGGYHPHFKKPDHYPVVPRMQLIYEVGNLVMKGEAYFALTPHMIMAGLAIDAIWHSGDIKAWFSAGIDFLLGWRPFHYEASAYIHLGASFTLNLLFTSVNITIHLGVDLNIWGPPFGGRAVIDLDIISFTIHFGDSPREELVEWSDFKSSFLPAKSSSRTSSVQSFALEAESSDVDGNLCATKVPDGLLKDLHAQDKNSFFTWLVDPNHFKLTTNTLIPVKAASYNEFALKNPLQKNDGFTYKGSHNTPTLKMASSQEDNVAWDVQFGILPMGLTSEKFDSALTVTLKKMPEGGDYTQAKSYTENVDDIAITPILKSSQAAMWGASSPGLNGPRLIDKTLVGLQLSPMIQHPAISLKADLWAMLFNGNNQVLWQLSKPTIDKTDTFNATSAGTTLTITRNKEKIICDRYKLTALTDKASGASGIDAARKDIVNSLQGLGLVVNPKNIDVENLATYPLWDWPMIRLLGEESA